MGRVLDRWKAMPRWRRVAWVLVLLFLALAAGLRPFVRWADPELAVAAWSALGDVDPWGNEIEALLDLQGPGFYWSPGPNGINEWRQGDDIDAPLIPPLCACLVGWSREILGVLAFLPAWLLLAPSRARRSPSAAKEAGRAVLLASVPTVLTNWLAFRTLEWQAARVGLEYRMQCSALEFSPGGIPPQPKTWACQIEEFTLVPAPVALAGSLALVCFLVALWWRLRRPLAEEEAGPP
jgi:hypothetical protein